MSEAAINQSALDRFTSAHAGVGITLAAFRIPWWAMLVSTVGWELIENKLKDARPDLFPYSSHDSLANSVVDSLAVALGFFATRHVMTRGLSIEGKTALSSSVGATLGGFVGSIAFGLVGQAISGPKTTMQRGLEIQTHGNMGYRVGCAMGAVVGAVQPKPPLPVLAAASAAAGGATLGPLGAALGAYMMVAGSNEALAA